jgi:hypothetical protein
MGVGGNFAEQEGMGLLAAALAQAMPRVEMDGGPSSQIRQAKIHAAITAIGGAKQGKQGLVLVDG